MNVKITIALLLTVGLFAFEWFIFPSLSNLKYGQDSMVRFDPKVSTDYDCINVEGYSKPRFTPRWLSRHTPVEYMRIRYTPHSDTQEYGIMFVDPRSMAYEAHAGFVASPPTRLAGRLDSPDIIRNWMQSQPQSSQASSHIADAQEIYDAVTVLAKSDLEDFTLPASSALSQFKIGFVSLPDKDHPHWASTLMLLFLIWIGVFSREKKRGQEKKRGLASLFGSTGRVSAED